ncbi:hypothetical protein HYH03_005848 [Edaphochlamys debaryana]|nr:hypothetical protein HYH03_005848 [Edaphochlamys debaryana]|eukprot:KAG2496250.1 hypothetical protein HYH03_005848 [Edaphochlamys debaryana]
MTSEILAVMLLVAGWSTMASSLAEGFELAQILCGEGPANTRVREVLLLQLAAKDVGEPHHLTAPQWEVVLYEALVSYAGITMQKSDLHCPMYDKARELLVRMGERIRQLDPDRPLSHRWLAMGFTQALEPADAAQLYSAAASMVRLGCDQGHDYAAALGGYLALFAQLRAEGRAPGLPAAVRAGELRSALAAARAARRRLERWGMWEEVHTQIPDHVEDVEAAAAALQDVPDDEEVPLPYALPPPKDEPQAGTSGSEDGGSSDELREMQAALDETHATNARSESVLAVFESDPDAGRELMRRSCHVCWKQYDKCRKCGGCKRKRYCSTQCQAKDWQNGHKEECKRLAEVTAAEEAVREAEAAAAEAAAAAAAAGTREATAAALEALEAVTAARDKLLTVHTRLEAEAAARTEELQARHAVALAELRALDAAAEARKAAASETAASKDATLARLATSQAGVRELEAAVEAAAPEAAVQAAEAEAADAAADSSGGSGDMSRWLGVN